MMYVKRGSSKKSRLGSTKLSVIRFFNWSSCQANYNYSCAKWDEQFCSDNCIL